MSSGASRPTSQWRRVFAVHDGDSIRVGHVFLRDGRITRGQEVRLIGIDAPEMYPKEDRPPEDGAEEARDASYDCSAAGRFASSETA